MNMSTSQINPQSSRSAREFESIAGLWKLFCALAILFGHNLVTLTALAPANPVLSGVYHSLQFFSPLQFLFFSGYISATTLATRDRPLRGIMAVRAMRIYVLVVLALVWGLAMRWIVKDIAGVSSLGTIWPLGVWDGPIDPIQILRHLNPFGFADHVQFNYATWYLYQELRIVLLFPLFRWILTRPSARTRWMVAGLLMLAAALLEYRFWSFFPLFRSSPFQSLAYGVYFLVGALVRIDLRKGGVFGNLGKPLAWGAIAVGLGLAYLEAFGIRPPLDNPPILMVQTLVGQVLLVIGIDQVVGNFSIPSWLRRACDWSVGIYIAHPPIHVLAAWIGIRTGTYWPFAVGIAISLVLGVLFHQMIERPSQGWVKRLAGRWT